MGLNPGGLKVAGAQQSIDVAVSAEQFFSVVTDYASYPEFLSDMESAELVRREGESAEARFTLNLIKRISYTLNLVERGPYEVRWSLGKGPFKRNDGSWLIEDRPGGGIRATYSIEVAVGVFLPGSIVNRLVGKTLPATLEAFKARAERLVAEEN